MVNDSENLTHLVYEASLDNSLWPELIIELTEQLLRVRSGEMIGKEKSENLSGLAEHFRRAFDISEKIVGLQEEEACLGKVLDSLSFGLALIGDDGQVMLANRRMRSRIPDPGDDPCGVRLIAPDQGVSQRLCEWVGCCNRNNLPRMLQLPDCADHNLLMLPRRDARRMGFPVKAAAVLLSTDMGENDGLRSFSMMHGLTRRETDLVGAIYKTGDLRTAAGDMGISYESARTYLKRVFEKTDCRSQAELVSGLARTPMAMLRKPDISDAETHQVRRLMNLNDGRVMEYFELGPGSGDVVVHFDALAGHDIDVLGYPAECLPHLKRHNIRLIIPCRPGTFRSDFRQMNSLRDFAPDVAELLDHLGVKRFGVSAVSFGSASALAVAHELQSRIDRVVLSSASYPLYQHPDWRKLDQFYQLSNVLGRKWPTLMRQILPFFVRSIMQNTDRFFDKYIKNSRCAHDIEILYHPTARRRTVEMLAERTSTGMAGFVEECLLNVNGWDFEPCNIRVPVELVHGVHDNVAPIEGAVLLAGMLPNAVLHRLPDKGHYHHFNNWPGLLARAAGRDVELESETYEIPLN